MADMCERCTSSGFYRVGKGIYNVVHEVAGKVNESFIGPFVSTCVAGAGTASTN